MKVVDARRQDIERFRRRSGHTVRLKEKNEWSSRKK